MPDDDTPPSTGIRRRPPSANRPTPPPSRPSAPPTPQGQRRPTTGREPTARHPETGDIYTQAQVEQAIMRIERIMEEDIDRLEDAAHNKAVATHAYKVKFARERLRAKSSEGYGPGGRTTDAEAEDHAMEKCGDEYLARLTAEALWDALEEKSRMMRAQLDALRTIAANIRAQT